MTTILTYSFAPAGVTTLYPTGTSVAISDTVKTSVKLSFREWERHGDFLNVEVPWTATGDSMVSTPGINTKFFQTTIDGVLSVLGKEIHVASGSHPTDFKSVIYFDTRDMSIPLPVPATNWLTLHEIGHGVAGNQPHNSTDSAAVMYPTLNIANINPTTSERTAVSNMYGAPVSFINKMGQGKLLGDLWSIYKGMGNTTPDAPGLFYWMSEIQKGNKTRLDVAWGFPTGGTNTTFVTNMYNRILGRAPDASGLAFYVGGLNNGTQNRPQIAVDMAVSAEAATYRKAQQTSFWLT